jgi:hypothetical protein
MNDVRKDELILKKDARILWNSENGKIIEVLVEEFKRPGDNHHLYQEYRSDIGNCLADWDKWPISYIFLVMFFKKEYIDLQAKESCMEQLLKIKEINDEVRQGLDSDLRI